VVLSKRTPLDSPESNPKSEEKEHCAMKSIRIHSYGSSGEMKIEDAPRPQVANDQLLVKVIAAGVNPVDWKIRSGWMKQVSGEHFPLTIGQDLAGEVAEVGTSVSQFKAGDQVFGFGSGSYAEYTAARAGEIALKPKSVDFATAASIPTACLTAWQALIDVAQVRQGQLVLVHGAAGGVGSFAVQIAKWKGARVAGTAAAEDADYLKSLGADLIIDYQKERFEERAGNPDVVLDLIGGETLNRSYGIVKKGGIIVSTVHAGDEAKARQAGVRVVNIVMKKDGSELAQIAQLVDQGAIKPRIDKVLPIDQAKQAHDLNEAGQTRGKIVLKVA
jgi:NADPH:quinone reductase-like Zn-dependent oxidoreductase